MQCIIKCEHFKDCYPDTLIPCWNRAFTRFPKFESNPNRRIEYEFIKHSLQE